MASILIAHSLCPNRPSNDSSVIAAKFDPQQAVRDIAAEKVTVMSEFAPMLAGLMDQAKGNELASLRAVTGLDTPATIERFETM